ncbi:hypothetical protein P3W33_09095 [Luteibacter sp. PPL552]
MKSLQTNEEVDTRTSDQDDFSLEMAKQGSKTKLARAMRRVTDRIAITRRKSLTQFDGKTIPYEAYRDELLAKKRAAWVAVATGTTAAVAAVVSGHTSFFVWIGTAIVTGGSAIIGNGAALAADARDWLEAIEAQQARQETVYVHEAALLRQLETVYNAIESPSLLPTIRMNLSKALRDVEWRGEKRYVITQSDSARLFLDAAKGTGLGTPLVILGGILIALAG